MADIGEDAGSRDVIAKTFSTTRVSQDPAASAVTAFDSSTKRTSNSKFNLAKKKYARRRVATSSTGADGGTGSATGTHGLHPSSGAAAQSVVSLEPETYTM